MRNIKCIINENFHINLPMRIRSRKNIEEKHGNICYNEKKFIIRFESITNSIDLIHLNKMSFFYFNKKKEYGHSFVCLFVIVQLKMMNNKVMQFIIILIILLNRKVDTFQKWTYDGK